jgi:peptidoglycan/xylan/chitin deacetylase (PgdA/CDA1 family)
VRSTRSILCLLAALALFLVGQPASAAADPGTPILVYHRFGPVAAEAMTVRTAVFESQLEHLAQHGYTVVPLRRFVDHVGGGPPLPPRSVVITVDDAHCSVHAHALPLIQRYRIQVTLFVYPSAISNAAYAMTWEQLGEIAATGLVDIQSHTYWHPNFAQEKKRLSPHEYERFVLDQLRRSKLTLERRLGIRIDMLAWPFGIVDDQLMRMASEAGYAAAVTLERRHATAADPILALPRYLVTDRDRGARFEALLAGQATARSADH